ncbi:MAG: fibronectin type III domain-containing protein [Actinomycetes bacterium]
MGNFARVWKTGVVVIALLATVVACGNSELSRARNSALVAGTACTKLGKMSKISKVSVVCAKTNKGKIWYPTMKSRGRSVPCTKPGTVRKKKSVVWVCGVSKGKKLWRATAPLPPAVLQAAVAVTSPGATETAPVLESTDVATPQSPVVADNNVLADPAIADDPPVTTVPTETTVPTVTAGVLPDAPTSIKAVRGNGQVTVSWNAPQNDGGSEIISYQVKSNGDSAHTCFASGSTSCIVTDLKNGESYAFTVTARNSAGNSLPSAPSAVVVPATVPGEDTSLRLVSNAGTSVIMAWSAQVDDGGSSINSYTVFVEAIAGPDVVSGQVMQGCTVINTGQASFICTIKFIDPTAAYLLKLVATNAVGSSPISRDKDGFPARAFLLQPTAA